MNIIENSSSHCFRDAFRERMVTAPVEDAAITERLFVMSGTQNVRLVMFDNYRSMYIRLQSMTPSQVL